MSDNVNLTPGTGVTIRTDDVGGVQYPVTKLDVGSDGVSVPVTSIAKETGGNLDAINTSLTGVAKDGTDITSPTAMPAGGTGIRGWLSAIWTKLNGTVAVSLASLPLATGASTAANQTTANTSLSSIDGKLTGPLGVTGTFWQATQPVSGPLTDAQMRASAVPVSNTSLPLPTGASTAAKQPAIGTAGTASADVISVQGIASMTALKVDGSAVTQPVSGTVTTTPPANASANVAQLAGTATDTNSGAKSAGTLRVVLATDQPALTNKLLVTPDLPAGAATAAKQPAIGTAGSSSTDVISVQGIASGTALPVSIASVPSHAVTNAGTFAVQADNTKVGGTNIDTNSGNKSAGTQRVVLATDQPEMGHIGEVGQSMAVVSSNFSRPADTTAYASGDLVANSTTAGSVVPLSWSIARVTAGTVAIFRARLKKSSTSVTLATFRLHLFLSSPTVSAGDNGVFNPTQSGYLGLFDLDMTGSAGRAFSDAAEAIGVPNSGNQIIAQLSSGQTIYGLLEARAAYVPASVETWTVELEAVRN